MMNHGPYFHRARSCALFSLILAATLWSGAARAGTWQAVGVGDCPGRDVAGSRGPSPEAGKCDASFAGHTAVCWAHGCTYKNVATGACTGGANPGQMYTCGAATAPAPAAAAPSSASGRHRKAAPAAPPASVWQPVGAGDCPGRDVAGSAG